MAGAQSLSPEERQKRIEEARRKAEEIKKQREATGQLQKAPAPPPALRPPSPTTAASAAIPAPPQEMSPEERQRRIEEAKRRAEEARRAREAGGAPAAVPGAKPAQAPAGPPKAPKPFDLGLREWAVVVRALEQGKQMILFLKGGIGEREFRVLRDEFILIPTSEGQEEGLIKPAFRPLLKEGASDAGANATSFARLFDVIPVRNLDKLAQLDEYHIFAKSYIDAKHNSRVDRPTNVLFLRVYRLGRPVGFEAGAQHGNWVEIKALVPLDGVEPALDEERFRALYREISTIIS